MAVSPVNNALSSVTAAFAKLAEQTTGGSGASSSNGNALQEATETKAQTTKEARAGDRVAKAKLQKLEAAQTAKNDSGANEPGKGTAVDKKG
ncbi:MAG: hypothetical protein M3O30_13855 [Planctomycetota bacterium]|nr:hypothetical protein [Planctomycetota bacterium]